MSSTKNKLIAIRDLLDKLDDDDLQVISDASCQCGITSMAEWLEILTGIIDELA